MVQLHTELFNCISVQLHGSTAWIACTKYKMKHAQKAIMAHKIAKKRKIMHNIQ